MFSGSSYPSSQPRYARIRCELFLHIAPNERGWAATLVKYLKAHGYYFMTADLFHHSLCQCTLAHYQQLRLKNWWIVREPIVVKIVWHPSWTETTPVNGREYSNAQNTATFLSDHNIPSTYLQTWCPLCFGSNSSENGDLKVDAIIWNCGRPKSLTFDPRSPQPELGRSKKPTRPWKVRSHAVEDEDKVEDNLKMPNSTYSACACGLPGEKQFYTCTLLDFLFKHLPHCWRIGVLYDIGCQMDQSLKKWNFMPDWSPHLEWGISIFHAYGHQWMCQLWYHPRKSTIWGLSDGEGVTGYHRHAFSFSIYKWNALMKRSGGTLENGCSKPIIWQSKTQGAHAIEHILSLQLTLEAQQENLQELISEGNDVIPEDSAGEAILVEWQERVHSTKLAISRLQSNIKKRTEGLKLGDWVVAWKLEQLKKDRWITMQLNLHILHEQLVQKLCVHKFKLATLDHAHSTWILDQKTKVHVEKVVHHHSPRIDAMMKKYNVKIKEMAEYHQTSRTISKSAYIPPLLLKEGLYKMDVDQDIWEDAWADVGDFPDGVLPQWLVDASVKKGIFMAQEVVNFKRLVKEVDDEVSFFALHQLHQLYEWLELWRVNMIHVPTLSTAPSWDEFLPPLTLEHHASCIQVHVPNVDGDDDDAISSDDDQDGEVEEDIETEDLGFITLIDNVIGDFQ
ncbi:hypothetical protein BS47DRAFT_1360268 [Hydnum rufescens UP504]|uniref:CxC2-like cysteine cluster KDZ transposase-associated domain-containing protein n=1 Tax=Hydnum rufescens UP504 TaxID=1448309 RepID=A0A9P6B2Y9_9AGAM|nr:hypothetical protein BS47DRAFT_1360268 [Hydnum rufescens UP504]